MEVSFASIGDHELGLAFNSSQRVRRLFHLLVLLPERTSFQAILGNNLQKIFMNSFVAKTQDTLLESFERLQRGEGGYDLRRLARLDHSDLDDPHQESSGPFNLDRSLIKIKEVEGSQLQQAIESIESDLKRLRELAGRLRAQVNNELQAASEEKQRIADAANALHS